MKYFDTFTGYGGFTLGIERALGSNGDKREVFTEPTDVQHLPNDRSNDVQKPLCIGYSEVNKYAIQVYEKHFPNHKPYGDITQINPAELPDFDLLTGGFPCQAFSIAGKRQGFNDTRGTLFFDIARILKEKRPRNFILENVKGLLSHDNGRTFKTIITTLVELGYCVEWQVLNAKNHGVPQNRERVFIVGHLGGVPERKVFPIGASNEKDIVQLNNPTHSNNRLYGQDGISPTLNTAQGGNRQPKIAHTVRTSGRASGIDKKQNWDSYEVGGRIRRLTPKECERLMGLPDSWTRVEIEQTSKIKKALGINKYMSDSQRYKLCGNGVVVNVVEAIVKKLYNL